MKKVLQIIGTGTGIAGAFLVAMGIIVLGYAVFLISAAAWCILAIGYRDRYLFALNAVYFTANIVGFTRGIML